MLRVCAAEFWSEPRMTDMKGSTCHVAFDLLSLEEDERGGKCQVIQVTHILHREGWLDECFTIKPRTHQPFWGWQVETA